MPEKFEPRDCESYEDLPEEEKENFKKVDDGFVRKEALDLEEARKRAEKMQEKIASGEAKDYNEAEKLVDKEKLAKAKEKIKHCFSWYLCCRGHIGGIESFEYARSLQKKYNISVGEIETDFELQKEAKEAMLENLRKAPSRGYEELEHFEEIKSNFLISDEIYALPEFQEAAKESAKNARLCYFGSYYSSPLPATAPTPENKRNDYIKIAHFFQQKFGIPVEEVPLLDSQREAKGQIRREVNEYLHLDAPDEQQKKIYSYQGKELSEESILESIFSLQQRCNISADSIFQEPVKDMMIIMMRKLKYAYDGYFQQIEKIKSLLISDEIYALPEFQEAVKELAENKLNKYLDNFDKIEIRDVIEEEDNKNCRKFIHSLLQKCNISIIPSLQEKAQKMISEKVGSVAPLSYLQNVKQQINKIKYNLNIPDGIFASMELQAIKQLVKNELDDYLNRPIHWDPHGIWDTNDIQSLQQEYNIAKGELESDPALQEKAKETICEYINDGHYNDAMIFKIKEIFNISAQTLADSVNFHNLILDNIASGNINDVVKIQEAFSISDEKLLSPEYVALARQALVSNFEEGNKDSIEKIKEKFLPELDIAEFIKNQYQSYINEGKWDLVVKLKSHFSECDPIFQEFFAEQKEIAKNNKLAFSERRKAFDILSGLAKNDEASVSREFSEIITARTKQKEPPESKWGLDPAQEAAFYTLMRLDNPDSNLALFNLAANKDVNSAIKYAIIKKITREHVNFLDKKTRLILHNWFSDRMEGKNINWHDLQFIAEILKIPSNELRQSSLQRTDALRSYTDRTLDKVFLNGKSVVVKDRKRDGESIYDFWQKKYNNIPQNVFLQVLELDRVSESEGFLDKFQKLFTSIRKESSKKDSLLYGITNVLETDPKILKLLGKKLETIDIGSKQDADLLSMLFRQVVFLNKIEQIKNYRHYDDNEDNDNYEDYNDNNADYQESDDQLSSVKEQEISPKILEIFNREIKGIEELNILLQNITTEKIREILPNENITAEKIEAIEKEWGDLEPIFTYLGRFPELKEYVAEIVANIDTAEGWKDWRYDLNKDGVKKQIGHLSEEQLEIWGNDYFSEIGDIMVAESGSDKPKQIQRILQDAILQHRHIFNPEMGQNKNEFIQKTLEGIFAEMEKTPDKQSAIIERGIKNISSDSRNVDSIINFNNLPRLRQSIDMILSAGAEITPSSKIKNTIGIISACLPPELKNAMESNYARLEDQKKIAVDELFTPEIRQAIEQKTKEIEENYQNALDSDIWEKFQLDKNNPKNLEQFYQKRQELKSATDLLRLLDLSNKLIATNKIAEKEGKKGGEAITSVLERLKKYFKDSPLAQDISNIEFVLKEKIDFGEKRRLAMIFTDNAQMLWQAGKYPLGNGSCQHYADGSYADMLMGYVGDPNCKIVYLVDLNKLPQSVRSEIEEKGFEEIKDRIPKQELLNASLARSIIKMTRDRQKKPAILLEPTYSVVNKGDTDMDKYFNLFVDLMVAEPMKAKMARGGGNESVIKGKSLSPCGQYEDLDLSHVKFIHKLSNPTKEDVEIMERIRSSR